MYINYHYEKKKLKICSILHTTGVYNYKGTHNPEINEKQVSIFSLSLSLFSNLFYFYF